MKIERLNGPQEPKKTVPPATTGKSREKILSIFNSLEKVGDKTEETSEALGKIQKKQTDVTLNEMFKQLNNLSKNNKKLVETFNKYKQTQSKETLQKLINELEFNGKIDKKTLEQLKTIVNK